MWAPLDHVWSCLRGLPFQMARVACANAQTCTAGNVTARRSVRSRSERNQGDTIARAPGGRSPHPILRLVPWLRLVLVTVLVGLRGTFFERSQVPSSGALALLSGEETFENVGAAAASDSRSSPLPSPDERLPFLPRYRGDLLQRLRTFEASSLRLGYHFV